MRMRRRGICWLTASLLVVVLAGCGKQTPVRPERDNPLDRHNPATRGDPFGLQAESGADGVRLRWTPVTGVAEVVGYTLYRQVDAGAFVVLRQVEGVTAGSLVDQAVTAGRRYTYYVVARDAAGQESAGHEGRAVCELGPDWEGTGELVVDVPLPE